MKMARFHFAIGRFKTEIKIRIEYLNRFYDQDGLEKGLDLGYLYVIVLLCKNFFFGKFF